MKTWRIDQSLRLYLISASVFVVAGISGSALGVVWIYVESEFNVSLSALGAVFAAATFGRVLTSYSSGPLINRLGLARVMLAGMLTTAASMLGLALAQSWLTVLLVAFGSGVGGGVMATGLNAFAAVNFSARQMNWLHGSYGLGSILGPLLITTIVIDLALDWRYAYIIFTLLRLGLAFVFWRTRREWRLGEATRAGKKSAYAGMNQTMRLPIIWLMMGAFMMSTGLEVITGQFANNFLIEARAIDAKTAGLWVSIYWASLTVSRFVSGLIIARISHGLYLRLNTAFVMLGAVLLWADLSPLGSLVGLGMIGFCVGPFAPLMASDTPRRVGRAHTANAIGLQFTGASLGMAVMPWLAGHLAEAHGLEIIAQFIFAVALATFVLHEGIVWRELRLARARVVGA